MIADASDIVAVTDAAESDGAAVLQCPDLAGDGGTPRVAHVVVGQQHACALYTDGRVACWGSGVYGQLGAGASLRSSRRPVFVEGLTDAVSLSAQSQATCALRCDGHVVCWGKANYGNLGDSTTGREPCGPEDSCRVLPTPVEDVTDAVALFTGGLFGCARRANGQILCWGLSEWAEHITTTSDGGTGWRNLVEVPSLADPIAIVGGGGTVFVLRAPGDVMGWGENASGILGDGTHTFRPSPVSVLLPPGTTGLDVGSGHACAVQGDARVACWGQNLFGQLGNGIASENDQPTPTAVPGLADMIEIAAGSNTSCARARDGHVWCWGAGDTGQLGDGVVHRSVCSSVFECSPSPVMVSGLTDAVQLAVSGSFVCARRATGAVVCWGSDFYGQLGQGTDGTECRYNGGADAGPAGDPCVRYAPVEVMGL